MDCWPDIGFVMKLWSFGFWKMLHYCFLIFSVAGGKLLLYIVPNLWIILDILFIFLGILFVLMLWNIIKYILVCDCVCVSFIILSIWWNLSIWKLVYPYVMRNSLCWLITSKIVKFYCLPISSLIFSLFLGICSFKFFYLFSFY